MRRNTETDETEMIKSAEKHWGSSTPVKIKTTEHHVLVMILNQEIARNFSDGNEKT